VEALLQITHPFFHTVQNYVPFRYQQLLSLARCITCQDVYVQHLHAAKCLPPLLEANL